jgi:uncharacterized damage-inducible protein DinB
MVSVDKAQRYINYRVMNISAQIAKHFRDVFTGGNWTSVNLKQTLEGITWQQAVTKVNSLNSIATLVFHINYYISAVLKVLQGEELKASDQFSFDLPPIQSQQEWEKLVEKTLAEAEQFAALVERLPEHQLNETFTNEKYGNYYRNIHGIIEHTHYHLGQIVLIKKLLNTNAGAYPNIN